VLFQLAAFAYNGLRLLSQLGLKGEIAPIRNPAKRRRIKTVFQEMMYRAATFVEMHAGSRWTSVETSGSATFFL
jgi:hypothetical protein